MYFADEKDDRKCCGCSSDFSVTCLKHACRKCNKFYCGKCSSSNVTTINRTLVRERLCTKCLDIQPNTPSSPGRSSKKTLFTPSKLHLLEGSDGKNAVSSLWSADTETDCDSDDCEDAQVQQEIKESVKENLSKSLLDEIVAFSNGNTGKIVHLFVTSCYNAMISFVL